MKIVYIVGKNERIGEITIVNKLENENTYLKGEVEAG